MIFIARAKGLTQKLLWQQFLSRRLKSSFKKILLSSSWLCWPLQIICDINGDWSFCQLACVFVLSPDQSPCNVWQVWHVKQEMLTPRVPDLAFFWGFTFCMAWTFSTDFVFVPWTLCYLVIRFWSLFFSG